MPRFPHAKMARMIAFGLRLAAAAQKAGFEGGMLRKPDTTTARLTTLLVPRRGRSESGARLLQHEARIERGSLR